MREFEIQITRPLSISTMSMDVLFLKLSRPLREYFVLSTESSRARRPRFSDSDPLHCFRWLSQCHSPSDFTLSAFLFF